MRVDGVRVRVRRAQPTRSIVTCHTATTVGLNSQVVHVRGAGPAFACKAAASHVGFGRSATGGRDLAPEGDSIRMVAQRCENALVPHEEPRRIITDPPPLAG